MPITHDPETGWGFTFDQQTFVGYASHEEAATALYDLERGQSYPEVRREACRKVDAALALPPEIAELCVGIPDEFVRSLARLTAAAYDKGEKAGYARAVADLEAIVEKREEAIRRETLEEVLRLAESDDDEEADGELTQLRQIVTCAAFRDFMNDSGYKEIEAIPEDVWQRLCQLDPVIAAATYRFAREGVRQYRKATREARQ